MVPWFPNLQFQSSDFMAKPKVGLPLNETSFTRNRQIEPLYLQAMVNGPLLNWRENFFWTITHGTSCVGLHDARPQALKRSMLNARWRTRWRVWRILHGAKGNTRERKTHFWLEKKQLKKEHMQLHNNHEACMFSKLGNAVEVLFQCNFRMFGKTRSR